MNNAKFKIRPWFGVFGLLGFIGLVPKFNGSPNYFMFIFFSFFGWYWWGKILEEKEDERLYENQRKVSQISGTLFGLLSFFMLFFLDRNNVNKDSILLFGSLSYAGIFILTPALIYYYDRVKD